MTGVEKCYLIFEMDAQPSCDTGQLQDAQDVIALVRSCSKALAASWVLMK